MTIDKHYEPICIFPTILKIYNFDKSDELKECLFEIINKKYEKEDYNSHHSKTLSFYNNISGCSLFKSHRDEYSIIKEFEEFTISCANDYVKILEYIVEGTMICTNSWVNYYSDIESHQEPHVHVNSFVSSNYFANYDKNNHAPLFFKKHEELASMPFISHKKNKETQNPAMWDTACFNYEEGDIIFWQSHLFHFVPQSKTPGRLSLACNYMPDTLDLGGYGFKITQA
jgi:uncharacterized protein (TIGR02466 family)